MAFSKLRQLSDRRLSPSKMADLIEEHIGDGSNEFHCELAYKALQRIHNQEIRDYVLTMARLASVATYREKLIVVIAQLRSYDQGNSN